VVEGLCAEALIRPDEGEVVGQVLLASMAEIAGEAWTSEFEQAWSQAFRVVAGAMIEGAEAVELEAAA
jgi:hemoglobin-like flavoprotein